MRESCILRYSFFVALVLISCGKKEARKSSDSESTKSFTYVPSSNSGVTFKNSLSNSEYDNIIVNPNFYDGAGVAVGDINNDGLTDIYFVSNQWENKLYLNKGDFNFEDITARAGVKGSSKWETDALMLDLNNDGFVDIYITGDESYIYFNSKDGTFTQVGEEVHTPDVYDREGLEASSVDSAMELRVPFGPADFINITNYAGVSADLCNAPLLADFDNDGLKDLFIARGIVGRINDPDYLMSVDSTMTVEERYTNMPPGAAPNFFFKQKENLKFENVTDQWIGRVPAVSTGAAYADFDNDGDLDIVVNNTNSEAFLMRNDLPAVPVKKTEPAAPSLTSLLTPTHLISYKHQENAFNPLNKQPLIPHSNAARGPKISVGDVNGDKLQDVFICGGQGQPGAVFIQRKTGKFVELPQPALEADKQSEETCSALLDVDGDKDLDLLIGSGGEEFLDARLLLRLYINNGRGKFTRAQGLKRADIVNNLQKIYVNASCIAPADIDNDGDMDVFVGGGVVTGRYGFDSDSFVLLNDGKGMLMGSPATFGERKHPVGMVQSAVWIDINNDKFPELITAGEWMTPTLWMNNNGVLTEQAGVGMDKLFGFWNSLAKADLDNDGDEDIVAGNFGLNTRFNVKEHPMKLYITDVDNNGTMEPIMAYGDKPVATRDQLLKQAPALAKKFPTYSSYSHATISQIVTGKVLFEREVNSMASMIFLNQGNGKFVGQELPAEAQWFPVFAIHISDVNGDGKKDLLLGGNLHTVSPEFYSNNDGYGLILTGNGDGTFTARQPTFEGFAVPGETRDIQSLNGESLFLVTRNNDSLLVFKKVIK